ncbi:MAG: tol-pal system protein YbgF [Roseovarius sp.]|nr:tol-pal system protein YbgF [Roseovarius sp.]
MIGVVRLKIRACAAVLALLPPAMAAGQEREQTLADIRQELSVIYVQIQRLKQELNTTGSFGSERIGGSVIERVDNIENEVRRISEKTEKLEFRIDNISRVGANRIGDIEFRLCEMDSECDIGSLKYGATLEPGSDGDQNPVIDDFANLFSDETLASDDEMEYAEGEQREFDRAALALEEEDYLEAERLFRGFQEKYPGSPLAAKAEINRGEALEGEGKIEAAARVYLKVFTNAPDGPEASGALLRLGRGLDHLGKTYEACLTLGEIEERFPGSAAVNKANEYMAGIGC